MHTEAKRLKIPTEGWTGGIVIDEMSIQEDLQICKSGDGIEIVGLVDEFHNHVKNCNQGDCDYIVVNI
jgi:hypothetical protein